MTTVNTFDDILDILDRNPEYQEALRQRVLDEERRQLPERIDRAVKSVDALAQTVAEFVRRTDDTLAKHDARLELAEGQITDLSVAANRVLETVADIQNRLGRVEGRMESMEGRMGSMEGRMESMEGQIGSMQGQMESMEGQIGSMQGQIGSMQGQLNNLNGTDYERRVIRLSTGIVRRHLGIKQARLMQALTVPDNLSIQAVLDNAVERRAVTFDQTEDVDRADIILLGEAADGTESYALAEISLTIDDHDIDRAHRRAAALRTASGIPVKAATVGTRISDANRERAQVLEVAVVIVSDQE